MMISGYCDSCRFGVMVMLLFKVKWSGKLVIVLCKMVSGIFGFFVVLVKMKMVFFLENFLISDWLRVMMFVIVFFFIIFVDVLLLVEVNWFFVLWILFWMLVVMLELGGSSVRIFCYLLMVEWYFCCLKWIVFSSVSVLILCGLILSVLWMSDFGGFCSLCFCVIVIVLVKLVNVCVFGGNMVIVLL